MSDEPVRNSGTPRYLFTYDGEAELTPHGAELARHMFADAAARANARANQKPSQPSLTFKTDAELRAFVERCTRAYLDEQLDARVEKVLDELARKMRTHAALQPGVWRKGANKE